MALIPQNSLAGANASTQTPQTERPPMELNGQAMNQQVSAAKLQGQPTAQAVTKAASNPNNRYYAKGGPVAPASPKDIDKEASTQRLNPKDVAQATKALQGEAAITPQTQSSNMTDNMFKSYFDKQGQDYLADRAKMNQQPQGYAKGGSVNEGKAVKKLVSEMVGQGQMGNTQPMKSTDMSKGGMPTANTQAKSEARSHAKGLMSMNDDVGTYKKGGPIKGNQATGTSDDEVLDNSAGMNDGKAPAGHSPNKSLMKMAIGGGLEGDTEADNITGYAPDGAPIITNADGTQQEGNVNDLLDRPSSASMLGTGATPTSTTGAAAGNTAAANTLGGNGTESQMMAKGGEENGPPPGALSKEVADNVPAKLSEGEFVMSADTTRFYGLRLLTMMQDHARQELAQMANDGGIRSPGDGKNPDDTGNKFMQDQKPNMNAYDNKAPNPDDMNDNITGIMKECSGGYNMAQGGGVNKMNPSSPRGDDFDYNTDTTGHEAKAPQRDETKTMGEDDPPQPYLEGRGYEKDLESGEVPYTKKGPITPIKDDNVKVAKGGLMKCAEGGGIGEEQSLKKGGSVYGKDQYPVGRDNMVSSAPKGGSVAQDYATGGIVSPKIKSLAPKPSETLIPSGQQKMPGLKKLPNPLPKMAKGGLLKNYNGAINKDTFQSYEGA